MHAVQNCDARGLDSSSSNTSTIGYPPNDGSPLWRNERQRSLKFVHSIYCHFKLGATLLKVTALQMTINRKTESLTTCHRYTSYRFNLERYVMRYLHQPVLLLNNNSNTIPTNNQTGVAKQRNRVARYSGSCVVSTILLRAG